MTLIVYRWEYDAEHYCGDVRRTPLYETGPLLLDIIDTCVFDFIIGNADRHHYEVFDNDPKSMLIMFDNGKRYMPVFYTVITFFLVVLLMKVCIIHLGVTSSIPG